MADLANDENIDSLDFLVRGTAPADASYDVLVSAFFGCFRVRQYPSGYTREPAGMVAGAAGFPYILREDCYNGLAGGMLEDLGQLFTGKTLAHFYPLPNDGQIKTLEDVSIAAHLEPLLTSLKDGDRDIYANDSAVDDV